MEQENIIMSLESINNSLDNINWTMQDQNNGDSSAGLLIILIIVLICINRNLKELINTIKLNKK